MIKPIQMHHIAIICSDYQKSKAFYTGVLGLEIIGEVFRKERQSYKLDLSLDGNYLVELFSFPDPPPRPTRPEATGLRHIAFEVEDLDESIGWLLENDIKPEPVRVDEFTGKKFTFFYDPDQLPIEFYER